MDIFVSTTFLGDNGPTDIKIALEQLEGLEIAGVELGSTHHYSSRFSNEVLSSKIKRFLVHNYCPPASIDLILNITSMDDEIRKQSLEHIFRCIQFSNEIGAEIYTFHAGFLNDPVSTSISEKGYDFIFKASGQTYKKAFGFLLQSLDKILTEAQKYSVTIAIETEGSVEKSNHLLMQTPGEFETVFRYFGNDVGINLNLAHMELASQIHRFSVKDFIDHNYERIIAVEFSHHNYRNDLHKSLVPESGVLKYLKVLPSVPWILEFRNSSISEIEYSIQLLKRMCK